MKAEPHAPSPISYCRQSKARHRIVATERRTLTMPKCQLSNFNIHSRGFSSSRSAAETTGCKRQPNPRPFVQQPIDILREAFTLLAVSGQIGHFFHPAVAHSAGLCSTIRRPNVCAVTADSQIVALVPQDALWIVCFARSLADCTSAKLWKVVVGA
jgi:hypothetical protein